MLFNIFFFIFVETADRAVFIRELFLSLNQIIWKIFVMKIFYCKIKLLTSHVLAELKTVTSWYSIKIVTRVENHFEPTRSIPFLIY